MTRAPVRPAHLAACAVLAWLGTACDAPPLDATRPRGSGLPPSGAITGTVVYAGPRPRCAYDADRGVSVPVGRVVLTLFRADALPPPEGDARSAFNLLTLPGSALFDAPADCLPEAPTPDDARVVVARSAPFAWPDIPLGDRYQIRGFYDADGDFLPVFPESSQPTAGDVVGGAVDPVTRAFVEIALDDAAARPNGQVRAGVTVSLGLPTWTERPVFALLDPRAALASSAVLPAIADPLEREQALYEAAGLTLSLYTGDAAAAAVDAAASLAVELDPSAPGYAWFLAPVDVDADGAADPHPILPGVPWTTPLLSLTRLRSAAEARAGLPEVTLVGSVRPSLIALGKQVAFPDLDVVVAPIALVDLDPGDAACTVPYVPPGNLRETYEAGPRVCQELPTGAYAVTALQGYAGGAGFAAAPDPAVTDTGLVLVGASLLTQSWTVPNALGAPELGPDGAAALPEQGAVLFVHDAEPSDGVGADHPGCVRAFSAEAMDVAPIRFVPVPDACCARVRPLCALPLCSTVDAPGRPDLAVRAGGEAADAGLTCLPFAVPPACCAAADG